MYDKNRHTNTHTNVWKKHAYKCMTKTGIQMYDKNMHTNAYKCMTKTGIQMYDKNRHTKTHTNVWKKQAYKYMTKTRIQMYEKNITDMGGRWRSGLSRQPTYRSYGPRYNWPRFDSRTRRHLLCVIPYLSFLFPVSLHCPIIKGLKIPKKFLKEPNTHTNIWQECIQIYEKNTKAFYYMHV